ncbi:hypothetical protein J4H85_04655, partial [Leucobacter tardus]
MPQTQRYRFAGHIAGAGTASGVRLVLGSWVHSPFGPFADVMIERADGTRVLIAPTETVAEFVAATYVFDEVRVEPVHVQVTGRRRHSRWRVSAGSLHWKFTVGARPPVGYVLRAVPPVLGRTRAWAGVTDRVARIVMPGVRTLGTAGNGRVEWYAAHDLHRLHASWAQWEGVDLGALAPGGPPPPIGVGSGPRPPPGAP